MMKKFIGFLTALMLMFAAISFISPDSAEAKGYKSGRKSYSPTQNETVVQKKDSTVNSSKVQQDSKAPATAKKSGGFLKGMLLGGIGGLLLGSLFAGLGPIGAILAFFVNMMLMVGIVMIGFKLFKHWKKKKRQQEMEAWRR